VLLVALAGLFAMHGLSDHGAGGHADAHGAAAPHARHGVAEALGSIEAALPVPRPTSAVTGTDVRTGMDMGLCVAVVGAGLLLLALVRREVRVRGLLPTTRDPRQPPVSRARAPDPPDLHRLSLQRC
jgi:hypothetical protein